MLLAASGAGAGGSNTGGNVHVNDARMVLSGAQLGTQ